MILRTLLASAATASMISAASAQETYPEITTPGFADSIDQMISDACLGSVYNGDMARNLSCADVTWKSAYQIAAHTSNYIQQERGRSISSFWAGAAQGELWHCERAVNNINASRETLDTSDARAVADYMNESRDVAISCLENVDNAENGIETWVDTPAQNHLIDHLNCQTNPNGCVRPSEFKL